MPAPTFEVRVTRTFDATADTVFDAWLTPRVLGRWMFGQREGERIVRLDVDPRVGGRFALCVDRQGTRVNHVGHYQVLQRPAHLRFTWAVEGEDDDDPSAVDIQVRALESGCELVLVHTMDARWSDYEDSARQSWTSMLDALAARFDAPARPA